MSSIVEYRECFTGVQVIHVAVDNFVLDNNRLSIIVPHVIVRYRDEIDATNTSEWLRSAGTMIESFCAASEGSFASGEVAYNEAQFAMDCTAPSDVQKKIAGEARGSNC